MTTLIICPACGTRYETKAAFPPEGRKVRCSKCAHVWQAQPVTVAQAAPRPPAAPAPQAAPRPVPQQQAPMPQAPRPPQPQAPIPQAPTPPQPPLGGAPRPEFTVPPPSAPQPQPPRPAEWTPPTPQVDADFEVDESLAAQVAEINAEVAVPPPPEKKEGFFARFKKKPAASIVTETDPARTDAALAEAALAEAALADAALANADLVAEAMGEKKKPKPPGKGFSLSPVTLGLAGLALLAALIGGLFLFGGDTVTSVLPGGSDTASVTQDLAFENVRYDWTSDGGGQPVLEVQGNVRNTGSASVTVPTVIIALRDEKGEDISEFTAQVNDPELDAGEEAPFTTQIASPPSNVRSLKVRFAKAE